MSALPESFRRDLDNLDDDSDDDESSEEDDQLPSRKEESSERVVERQQESKKDLEAQNESNNKVLDVGVSKHRQRILALRDSSAFKKVVEDVKSVNDKKFVGSTRKESYDLVMGSNSLIFDIDRKMFELYRLVTDLYNPKFPELPSIVQDSFQYINTVKLIGNKTI